MYGMTRPTAENQLRLMSAEPDWLLVDRHLSGECTPEEQHAITAWIAADPSHAQLMEAMRRVWRGDGFELEVLRHLRRTRRVITR